VKHFCSIQVATINIIPFELNFIFLYNLTIISILAFTCINHYHSATERFTDLGMLNFPFPDGGFVLGSSKFSILPQLPKNNAGFNRGQN